MRIDINKVFFLLSYIYIYICTRSYKERENERERERTEREQADRDKRGEVLTGRMGGTDGKNRRI